MRLRVEVISEDGVSHCAFDDFGLKMNISPMRKKTNIQYTDHLPVFGTLVTNSHPKTDVIVSLGTGKQFTKRWQSLGSHLY